MIDYEKLKAKRIAVLLSGGVDSSVVVHEFAQRDIHPDKSSDEYVPLVLTVNNQGAVAISRDTEADATAPEE